MITITIKNTNRCQLTGDPDLLREMYNRFQVKHPGAWHMKSSRWDGKIKYISEYGTFEIGLLSMVYKYASKKTSVKIIDMRPSLKVKPLIPTTMGDLTLRPEQIEALEGLLNYKVGDMPFYICAGNLAVNFGKSLIFCSIYEAFYRQLPTVLLLNDRDLFEQFKTEMPKLLPGEEICFIQGKVTHWGNFNIAMVQSLAANLKYYEPMLKSMVITLLDEADVIGSKTYKSVIQHLTNSTVRIGLSGTLYKGQRKKHIINDMNVRKFIGSKAVDISLKQQMDRGRSTPVVVKSITLDYPPIKPCNSYEEEYHNYITDNPKAYEVVLDRIQYNLQYGRLPMLIATKLIPHTDKLLIYLRKELPHLRIKCIHNKIKNRNQVLEETRQGKIDILIASTVITRGKNIPTLKYVCNTASMDAEQKTIQLLGRLVRTHESKTKGYIDDLIFPGKYLGRHGRHRKVYYQREKMKVIQLPRRPKKQRNKKSK